MKMGKKVLIFQLFAVLWGWPLTCVLFESRVAEVLTKLEQVLETKKTELWRSPQVLVATRFCRCFFAWKFGTFDFEGFGWPFICACNKFTKMMIWQVCCISIMRLKTAGPSALMQTLCKSGFLFPMLLRIKKHVNWLVLWTQRANVVMGFTSPREKHG